MADLEARCQQTVTHGLKFGLPPVFVKKKIVETNKLTCLHIV